MNDELLIFSGSNINDRYEILSWHANGSISELWIAWDRETERQVILKFPNRNIPEVLEMTRGEDDILRDVTHHNLVQFLDSGNYKGFPFSVYEVLDGFDLGKRVAARGPFGASEIIEIGLAACSGLSALHKLGRVHGDPNPRNLFQTAGGTIKLIDPCPHVELPDSMSRAPFYIAPEVYNGEAFSVQGDIFTLGMSLFFYLAGKAMQNEENIRYLREVRGVHNYEESLAEVGSVRKCLLWGAPPALLQAILKATSPDKDSRYTSVDAFKRDLWRARNQLRIRYTIWTVLGLGIAGSSALGLLSLIANL